MERHPMERHPARSPFVSVITPFLNVSDYLEETIESVLEQSFEDWELILVNDGSTDSGPEIARAYASRHPDRITLLEHPGRANRGSSESRNLGAEAARGEWLAYLDADDVWRPGKLAEQVRIVREHPEVGLVVGASLYWRSWRGPEAGRDEIIPVGAPQDTVIEPPRLHAVLYPLHTGAAPTPSSVLVRAELVRRLGGWEGEFPTAYDDQAFLSKLYLETPAYVSSRCWDRYRQRPDSCMVLELGPRDYHRHRRRFLEWFERYLAARGLADSPCWADLQRALRRYRQPVRHRLHRLASRAIGGLKTIALGR